MEDRPGVRLTHYLSLGDPMLTETVQNIHKDYPNKAWIEQKVTKDGTFGAVIIDKGYYEYCKGYVIAKCNTKRMGE